MLAQNTPVEVIDLPDSKLLACILRSDNPHAGPTGELLARINPNDVEPDNRHLLKYVQDCLRSSKPITPRGFVSYLEGNTKCVPIEIVQEKRWFNRLQCKYVRLDDYATFAETLKNKLVEHKIYVQSHGEDMEEIRNWSWTPGPGPSATTSDPALNPPEG